MNYCLLCKRKDNALILGRHHLKTKRTDKKEIELICRECHKAIHGLFKQSDLRDPKLKLDCVEGLLENKRLQKAIKFIQKIPPGTFMKMKESKYKKGNGK
jgi:hypothetical protein